jgi:hypothetical protein
MKIFVTAALAASLIATNLYAAEAVSPAPLPAGKPAGVQKAQLEDSSFWWIAGGVFAAGIIAVAASGGSTNFVASGTAASTATS